MTTLEKIHKLERYFYQSGQDTEPVIDKVIEKLINREKLRLQELDKKINNQLKEFEDKYGMSTDIFIQRFQKGELGDDMDYIEWEATCEMSVNVKKHLNILNEGSSNEQEH